MIVAAALSLALMAGQPAGGDALPAAIDACVAGLCIGQPLGPATAGLQMEGEVEENGCARYSGGALPAGISLLALDGRIARFEFGLAGSGGEVVSAPGVPFGLQLGMSLAEAGQRLPFGGHLQLEPHKYAWPPGLYLTWQDDRGDFAVRAVLPDQQVSIVLWGVPTAVALAEGCG